MVINSSDKSPFEIRDSTGKEFKEIYDNQGRLLFKNWNEIQGSPPITFKSYADYLTDYRIYGNTMQNGTPSPEGPVDVVGCGVRTEQLFEDKIIRCSIDGMGRLITNPYFDMYIAKVEQGVTYTASAQITGGFYTTKPVIGSVSYNGRRVAYVPATITASITGYMVFRVNSGSNEPMLSLGSTALPYEPYGYKIPVTVSNGTNSITTPVYIGSEPLHKIGDYADYVDYKRGVVVRRIKKLVLTGEESDWRSAGEGSTRLYNHTIGTGISYNSEALCNVAEYSDSVATSSGVAFDIVAYQGILVIRFHAIDYATLNEFKSYLAAQYAAGTPVTVWYVLAEPEEEPMENLLPIQTIKGTNSLTADTTVQPSEMYLKGKIKPVT